MREQKDLVEFMKALTSPGLDKLASN
jgi:hypothetical protein